MSLQNTNVQTSTSAIMRHPVNEVDSLFTESHKNKCPFCDATDVKLIDGKLCYICGYRASHTNNANIVASICNHDSYFDFDLITSVSNGSFASKLLTVDIYSQTYREFVYSMQQAETKKSLLNKYKLINKI